MTDMQPPVWETLDDDDARWAAFAERFCFRPGTTSESFPGIEEPPGSVTFSVAPVFTSEGPAEWLRHSINFTVVWALAQVVGPQHPLLVLDWQHPSYHFWPHRNETIHPSEMLGLNHITPVPDGDYFAFVSEDLLLGTFGHPWEQTLCVWGAGLLDALLPSLRSSLPIVRSSV